MEAVVDINPKTPQKMLVFDALAKTIAGLDTAQISDGRRQILRPLVDYIQSKVDTGEEIRLNFVCTHNSRRSHLSQVWAQALACHHQIPRVACYSGGTEATAVFPSALQALQASGFQIYALSDGPNPVYSIKYADGRHPVIGFSKRLDAAFNPQSGFAAIMVCSQADEACPFVLGTEARIPITYEDPKAFDHTPLQAAKYLERSLQIATELFHVFSEIKMS